MRDSASEHAWSEFVDRWSERCAQDPELAALAQGAVPGSYALDTDTYARTVMPELGHFPHAENPPRFAAHLTDAITTIDTHRPTPEPADDRN
ncbi:hypothetical protein [Streptomonospora salina]|uniref:Pimeloyl-ACP methyl ester carboxylesterase n=1 Tax=Streptomonospora salina TaxID=104205 RepID=A0A841ECE9_9ACTN|nr:hypothetical protein [Streptomonospora salina]MBB5998140.1 pimeloyl-ACP methyl ester carboxylesterase [Streptomonospora salina]